MDKQDVQRTNALVGALLRQRRNASGMTQDDVAAALNVDRRHIGRIESAEKPISIYRLIQICNVIGIDAGVLVSETQERLKNES